MFSALRKRMTRWNIIHTVSNAFIHVAYATCVLVFLYYLARAIQANRILSLVFDACLTLGLAVFLAYGLYDSYKVFREVERRNDQRF